MTSSNQNISLITTVYNEETSIMPFLQSYQAQRRHANEFIIVDGGSTDRTAEMIGGYAEKNPHLNIKLLVDATCSKKLSKGPIARGRNVAIAEARHEIIAVTDAGCLLSEGWLEEIVQPFTESAVDVVAGWYEPTLKNSFQERYAGVFLPSLATLDRENFLPSSRSIAFRKEAWAKVGGYPEGTYTAEDTAFDISLKTSGCRFAFNDRAVVYWSCPKTLDEACKKHYMYGFGDGQYRLFKAVYGKIIFGLLFPCKYLFRSKYREVGGMAYLVNASLVKGYLKGFVTGVGKSR